MRLPFCFGDPMPDHLMNTYLPLPVSFTHGEGAWLFDANGNRYLDALGGIAVCALGHAHPAITQAICDQAGRLLHSSNLYQIDNQNTLADVLCEKAGMERVFFSNSGAEANEAALKLARLYGHQKGIDNPQVIVTEGSFHGRTMATLTATGNRKIQAGFEPLVPGFLRAPYNDTEALRTIAGNSPDVVAILVEPITGEGGIRIPDENYLSTIRGLCDEHGWLMMLDEIQTGMGRTGTLWACEEYGIVPDILTFGKAFGGGVMPITGIIARPHLWTEELQENPWVLGSPTFGGNPLACSAAIAAIKFSVENDLPGQIKEKGDYFMQKLAELRKKYKILVDVRGKGFLIGLEYPTPEMGWAVSKGLFKRGVLTGGTLNNAKVNRIEPPGIIRYETIDLVIQRLDDTLTEVAEEHHT